MPWFKRTTKGIRTSTEDKKDTPQGLWYKSPTGKIIDTDELAENFYVPQRTATMFGLGVKSTSIFFLTKENSKSLIKKYPPKTPSSLKTLKPIKIVCRQPRKKQSYLMLFAQQ